MVQYSASFLAGGGVNGVVDGPTVCGEVIRVGYLFSLNFIVTRFTVLTEVERRH